MTLTNNSLLFAKVKDNAVIPKKRDEDAGYDLYACFDEPYMIINANSTVNIPTGIMTAFPTDVVAVIKERGSTGSKGIGQRCGVIDSGYRGEWFVTITNHNDKDIVITKNEVGDNQEFRNGVWVSMKDRYIIYPYQKAIAQALFVPLAQLEAGEVSSDEVLSIDSERGGGKIGSSGK